MKKLLVAILIFLSFSQSVVFAEGETQSGSTTKTRTVIVSERVMGANCTCGKIKDGKFEADPKACALKVEERKYQCTITEGIGGFQSLFASIIRWFIYIAMLLGVLAIVGLGILWTLAGGEDSTKKTAVKKWAINLAIGFIILFFFRYILLFLAPWIFQ